MRQLIAIAATALVAALLMGNIPVSAASVYDDAYRLTDHLYLKNGERDLGDVQLDYHAIIANEWDGLPFGWNISISVNGTNVGLNSEPAIAMRESWFVNKKNWTISQIGNGDGSYRAINLKWSEHENMQLDWYSGSACTTASTTTCVGVSNSTSNKRSLSIWIQPGYNTIRITYLNNSFNAYPNVQNTMISNDASGSDNQVTHAWNYLTNVNNNNLPEGYSGTPIRDTMIPPPPEDAFSAAWRYQVDDFNLQVQSVISDDILNQWQIEVCEFQIPNNEFGDNFTTYTYDCETKPVIEHEFEKYGSYNVIHRVQTASGHWFEVARVLVIDGSSYGGVAGNVAGNNAILQALSSITTETFGLTNIIMAPLTFLGTLPNAINSCSALTLPVPHGGNLVLPCMKPWYQANFGTLFTIWQTVITGMFAYFMGIRIFAKVKETLEPTDDRINVVEL